MTRTSMAVTSLRVGLCGIGLDAYWSQFAGLHERLEGYIGKVAMLLEEAGANVEMLGLVDTPQKGREAGHASRRADIDLLIIYVTTYALSSTVLPIVQRARVPVLVLNLQPEAAIDYDVFNRLPDRTAMTGEWLAFCSSCPIPEIANVLRRAKIPFHQVTGVLGDDVRLGGNQGVDRCVAREKGSLGKPHRAHGALLRGNARYRDRSRASCDHIRLPPRTDRGG